MPKVAAGKVAVQGTAEQIPMRGIDADDDVLEVVVAIAILHILEADLQGVSARRHAGQDLRRAAGIHL
jgi:hypothetical protein